MGLLFMILYPLITFISCTAYWPQIKKLMKSSSGSPDFCLKTWFLWVLESVVIAGYAYFTMSDLIFAVTACVPLVLDCIIIYLVLRNRFVRTGQASGTVDALGLWLRMTAYDMMTKQQALFVRVKSDAPRVRD
ncbi:MAG: hypothetical protein QF692_08415 [Alphaproteobacteria bacterium]|jgi:hypothetical protein|nr:hypothetical protein [Alphaproteobacteria bacterium]MDP7223268.1 hypothetical protein [Alphaproteobacteria bacterium]